LEESSCFSGSGLLDWERLAGQEVSFWEDNVWLASLRTSPEERSFSGNDAMVVESGTRTALMVEKGKVE
jgi:hypothetical protein